MCPSIPSNMYELPFMINIYCYFVIRFFKSHFFIH